MADQQLYGYNFSTSGSGQVTVTGPGLPSWGVSVGYADELTADSFLRAAGSPNNTEAGKAGLIKLADKAESIKNYITPKEPDPPAPTPAEEEKVKEPSKDAGEDPEIAVPGTPQQDGTKAEVDDKVPGKAKSETDKLANNFVVGSNPLHEYVTYTYNLSLHILSVKDWNSLTQSTAGWKPSMTLIGGAGRKNEKDGGFRRSKYFTEDFFIDKLDIKTIIGGDNTAGSSNVIEFKFNIIEPLGMTLLNRLIKAANDPLLGQNPDGANNYLEMAYCLQIDFFGYGDAGVTADKGVPPHKEGAPVLIPGMTRFLPFKFIGMSIKTGTKGTEYSCTAIPYGANAFSTVIGATPANFEVQAKDLETFFDSKSASPEYDKIISERAEAAKKAADKLKELQANGRKATQEEIAAASDEAKEAEDRLAAAGDDNAYKVNSYVSAYNAWQKSLKIKGLSNGYDSIEVKFAKEILRSSRIVQTETQPAKSTPQSDRGKKGDGKSAKKVVKAQSGANTGGPKFDSSRFSITAGTQVAEVINMAMKQSDYWRDQMSYQTTGPLKEEGPDAPPVIKAWKIVPQVVMGEFDTKLKRYHYHVTYYVIVQVKFNRKHPNAPKTFPKGWHRTYQYLYTGKNTDIIDWALDFEMTFLTSAPADAASKSATSGSTTGPAPGDPKNNVMDSKAIEEDSQGTVGSTGKKAIPGKEVNPTVVRYESGNKNDVASGANKDPIGVVANSVYQSLYGESVDMINVNLTIVGDPGFIKQDEVFNNPSNDGSLNFTSTDLISGAVAYRDTRASLIRLDGADVHLLLVFKTPIDFDPETGLNTGDLEYQNSIIGGLYSVIEVNSTFDSGKFTQKIQCIRLADQEDELANAMNSLNKQRPDKNTDKSGDNKDSGSTENTNGEVKVEDRSTKEDAPSDAAKDPGEGGSNAPTAGEENGPANGARTTTDENGYTVTTDSSGVPRRTEDAAGNVQYYDQNGMETSQPQDFSQGNRGDLKVYKDSVDSNRG